jgi:hypothetical protein
MVCQSGGMRDHWLRKTIFALIAGLAFLFPALSAEACETVEYRPTPSELKKDARAFFEQQSLVYEGVILGGHNLELGGHFLVLKVYKGSAKPFTIVALPSGSSCYSGVPFFAVGFWADYSNAPTSFDGLVSQDYVESWKRQGLVYGGGLSPSRLIVVLPLLVTIALITLIALLVRKRRRKTV